jgi:hypothetical protein
MSSTLPSLQPIDTSVPVVSAGGGTPSSYKDPKSPSSIMLKAKTLNVQSQVDSQFDSNQPTHESFRGGGGGRWRSSGTGSTGGNQIYLLALIAGGLLGLLAIKLRRRR